MTTTVEREFVTSELTPEQIWKFISKPENRADAISFVSDYEKISDSEVVWKIELPLIRKTAEVRTEDIEKKENEYVKFVGNSSILEVVGEHKLETNEEGQTVMKNIFRVTGKLPGVESFFKKNVSSELDSLEDEIANSVEES